MKIGVLSGESATVLLVWGMPIGEPELLAVEVTPYILDTSAGLQVLVFGSADAPQLLVIRRNASLQYVKLDRSA